MDSPSKPFALLQDGAENRWLTFVEPVDVLAAHRVVDVVPTLEAVARRVEAEGLWAAGFVAYEAAPAFDSALAAHDPSGMRHPVLWFGLFAKVERRFSEEPFQAAAACQVGPWEESVDRVAFGRKIGILKRAIGRGETYQVNYTYRLRAAFEGDSRGLFNALIRAQRCRYGGYLEGPGFQVCSASPELFFERDGDRITTRPMKGTAPRGRTLDEDLERRGSLADSPKERAENVMIVDMMRNDLGRIAEPGSVAVSRLFDVERYPTVLQMTSTVQARSSVGVVELFRALFPCASITGAPKARTSQIIARLEDEPRGVYTGAVGFIAPDRRARFSVAIRTAVVQPARSEVVFGVGGGIVWDSRAAAEYRETKVKAKVLSRALRYPEPTFELFETMRWTATDGCYLLERHLERLARSAEYFDFACDLPLIRSLLTAFEASGPRRLRLRLSRRGKVRLEVEAMPSAAPEKVVLAQRPVDSQDPFLFHKTTRRRVYDEALAAVPEGCDDVLLWNERRELTESCRANVALERDGRWITPPVTCGLLGGTLRAELLARGELFEGVITTQELAAAPRLRLLSALRGLRQIELVGDSPPGD
ncbi:MAG: aminodeoxychorismate synthase component I [Acidobacteriota bacterium]